MIRNKINSPSKFKKPFASFITRSVSDVVRVAQQLTCLTGGTQPLYALRNPNGRGGWSPGCSSKPE